MSVLFDASNEGIERTAGSFISMTSDFTISLWVRAQSSIPSAGQYRTFWEIYNDPTFNTYFGFYQLDTGKFQFYAANNVDPDLDIQTSASLSFDRNYYLTVKYNATTKLFTFLINGVVINTGTLDMSAATMTKESMGVNAPYSSTVSYQLRVWQRELTTNEIIAEMASATVVSSTSLFEDIPLTSDANDISGNSRDYSVTSGTPTYQTTPPNNINSNPSGRNANAAIVISSLPYSTTQDVNAAGITYNVWYKYVADFTGELYIFGFGDLVGYSPLVDVWLDPQNDPTSYNGIGNTNKPIQIPVTNGVSYYFLFHVAANVGTAVLTLNVKKFTQQSVPAGSLLINDDTENFPLVIASATADEVLRFVSPFCAGEQGDSINSGKYLFTDDFASPTAFNLYNSNFELVTTIAHPFSGSNTILLVRTCIGTQSWFVAKKGTAPTNYSQATKINSDGSLGPTVWTLGTNIGTLAIAANNDESILYFSGPASGGFRPIKRWDLINNIALSDLVADVDSSYGTTDILVLDDDTIVVMYYKVTEIKIVHYDTSGSVLNTYLRTVTSSTGSRMTYGLDSTSFWIMRHSSTKYSIFEEIKVSDGTILTTRTLPEYEGGAYQPAATATPEEYGPSFSCPVVLSRLSAFAQGTIVVAKVTNPVDNDHDFNFTAVAPLSPTTFTLKNEESQEFTVDVGTYSVVEDPDADWTPTYMVSNDSVDNEHIEVAEGESVTVLVLNTLRSPGAGVYAYPLPGNPNSGNPPAVPTGRSDEFINQDGTISNVKIPNPYLVTGFVGDI